MTTTMNPTQLYRAGRAEGLNDYADGYTAERPELAGDAMAEWWDGYQVGQAEARAQEVSK